MKAVPVTPEALTFFIEDGCIDRTKLCERCEITEDRLASLENGDALPNKEEWFALAEALRRSTAALFLPAEYFLDSDRFEEGRKLRRELDRAVGQLVDDVLEVEDAVSIAINNIMTLVTNIATQYKEQTSVNKS